MTRPAEVIRAALALAAAIHIHDAARGLDLSEAEVAAVTGLIADLLKIAMPLLREVAA
jgi:hypothetical protein